MDVIELWWLSLGIFAAVTVVVAVLLGLIISAAKSVDRHAADIWVAGKQIAGNTVSIWMLGQTLERSSRILENTRELGESAASINTNLRMLAGSSGRRG